MSAKLAAEAYLEYDCEAKEVALSWAGLSEEERTKAIQDMSGTFTLSLAAHAGGVSETQVLVAAARLMGHQKAEQFVITALAHKGE